MPPEGEGGTGQPGADGGEPQGSAGAGTGTPAPTVDEWLETLDDAGKAFVSQHVERTVTGLKNTVEALRNEIREAKKTASPEVLKQLEELGGKLELETRRASFIEDSVREKCADPSALWVLALSEEAFDSKGRPDWRHLRAQHPLLFTQEVTPRGNAGSGTGTPPPASRHPMDDALRRAAGRS